MSLEANGGTGTVVSGCGLASDHSAQIASNDAGCNEGDPEHSPTGRASQQNDLDARFDLPGTSGRTSGSISVLVHTVTAIVGAGVLGLPLSMANLTWAGGTIILLLSWITSLYTLWQLCGMHEMDGLRFNRYHELGQFAFGPQLGIWFVVPFQVLVMTGLGIVYMITGGSSMLRIWQLYGNTQDHSFGLSAWILVFFGLHLFLSQIPNFNQLKLISLAAAVTSIGYSTLAISVSLHTGRNSDAVYNLDGSTADRIFKGFTALGAIAFAFGGHNVALEIQATMPSPPPTFKPYMRGVYFAYALVSWCYFGAAFAGYWAFGNKVQPNILYSLEHPRGVVALANLMVAIHVTGSYQVYSMPIYDMIETVLVRRGHSNGLLVRIIYRSLYTTFTAFVAISLPFFIDIMGLIGSIAFGPTTFTIPSAMYLIIREPARWSRHWIASWCCIVYGAATTIFGSIGSLREIIVRAANYRFYS